MKRSAHLPFSPDLTRLFAAAVVSPEFCQVLLDDAALALAHGYHGETFALPPAEEALVLSVTASTLADFAAQVVDGSLPVEATEDKRPAPTSMAARVHHSRVSVGAVYGV